MTECMEIFGEFIKNYGYPAVALAFAFYLVLRIIKSSDLRDLANTQSNKKFTEAINATTEAINMRTESAKEFQGFVREEHRDGQDNQKEIIKVLERLHTQHENMIEMLGRINGYEKKV